ncbi:hypothetical protein QWZ06_19255 [Chryseobacterium tructae]|uniref:Uncharacterized protein n=1 Tax=Chryseobacterium tructae TaxID=1037380 RepID=A0ABV7Y4D8_9FLAO|nr:hypothetical protein [Chryseobacterium tructae]MDN3694263.1 hypothetical protein [Chryseobacterium tructae]
MITEKIKNIFCFIDFLESNIALFNKQKTLLDQIDDLRKTYNDLDPKVNFKHKFEREKIAEKGDKLVNSFRNNCKNLINEKISSLEITDLSNIGNNHFYNIGDFVILVERQKYDQEDVKLILEAKSKYVSILENLELSLDNFLPYDLVRDFHETLYDCFKPFLSFDDKHKIEKSKQIQFNRHQITIETLDEKGIRNAVNKLQNKSVEFEFEIDDWIINNGNIFEITEDFSLSFFAIQTEILKQCKANSTGKFQDFITYGINISKLITGTDGLSIENIFKEFLDLEINSEKLEYPMTVSIILGYLKIGLLKMYLENTYNSFLHTEKYIEKYDELRIDFTNTNIDTNESDFIKNELKRCLSFLQELKKPVYNEISILGDTKDEFCSFKKHLLNTVDKRQSFLNRKLLEFENLSESEKYEQSRKILKKFTEEDIERIAFAKQIGIKKDDEYLQIPEPKSKAEAIERFKKHDTQKRFETLKELFLKKCGNYPNDKIIEDELNSIYKFIDEANKLSTIDAFKNKDKSDYLEYLRLANGFYENSDLPFINYYTYFNYSQESNSLLIYAKYFLYKKWLEEKKSIHNNGKAYNSVNTLSKEEGGNYKNFTKILNKMYEDDFDYKPNLDYVAITKDTISEIKEKLFELQNNEQRTGFLKMVFRGFFDDGKDYHLYQVSKFEHTFKDIPLEKREYSEDRFNFIYECLLCLRSIITTISEESLVYNIDFGDVMHWSWRHSENGKQNPYEVFVYHIKGDYEKGYESNPTIDKPEQQKTKSQLLSENLRLYGFFELEKLKNLSDKNKNVLIQLLTENKLPYVVAMLDYLEYFTYLEKNHFKSKYKLYIEVSRWFNSDKDGRAIKGNISSLLNNSTENKSRYTAFKYKERVNRDYEKLL